MATATQEHTEQPFVPPQKMRRGRGPGKYKVLRGTHMEGERVCVSCNKKFRFKGRDGKLIENPHATFDTTVGKLIGKPGHEIGPPVIYGSDKAVRGSRLAEERGDSTGVNGGSIVDSMYDLSLKNEQGRPKKFEYIESGTHTPKSQEKDQFESMNTAELMGWAEENEVDLMGAVGREDILAAIRQFWNNT